MNFLAALSIVCAGWFQPTGGWYQPARAAVTLDKGAGAPVESWVANFHVSRRYGISRGFPADGVYISVNLVRPPALGSVWRPSLGFPLRLSAATRSPSFKPPDLTLYSLTGRFRREYNVAIQVIVKRDTRLVRANAQAELGRLLLPRWVPTPSRC